LHNAQAFERAGAAKLFLDREWTGTTLYETVTALANDSVALQHMGESARGMARPGAASRAVEILEEVAR